MKSMAIDRRKANTAFNAALLALAVLFGGWIYVDFDERQTATEAALVELRELAETAKIRGDEANERLKKLGRKPVPIPRPGKAPDVEVLAKSAVASAVAALPRSPTVQQVGEMVAREVAATRISRDDMVPLVADQVADYLRANPPPPGEDGADGQSPPCLSEPGQCEGEDGADGAKGEPGRPPTSEEIQTALDEWVKDNPNALCPLGGEFKQVTVMTQEPGGPVPIYTCVV